MRTRNLRSSGQEARSHLATWQVLTLLLTFVVMPAFAQDGPWLDTIRLEVDYMVERDPTGAIVHSHMPQPDEVAAVQQMFACQDILMIIEVSDEVPHVDVMRRSPEDSSFFEYYGEDSFGSYKFNYRDHWDCWHYCIFIHKYESSEFKPTGSSGLGEVRGDEFVVSLGGWTNDIGTPYERAATMAHELGHNLNLVHAGVMEEDSTGPHTPNFPSIMSYFCQLAGVKWKYENKGLAPVRANLLKNLDYSDGRLCALDENALIEQFGVGMKAVDWNCNGVIDYEPVANDLAKDSLGHWCDRDGPRTVLTDRNDWDFYHDYTCAKDRGADFHVEEVSCITRDEFQDFMSRNPDFRQPPLEVEPCRTNTMHFVIPGHSDLTGLSCSWPWEGFVPAYEGAAPGDILYLKFGVYDEPYESILLNKPMIVTATDPALIRPALKK